MARTAKRKKTAPKESRSKAFVEEPVVEAPPCAFLDLPVELYDRIYDSLSLPAALRLAHTCRTFNSAIDGRVLERCCLRDDRLKKTYTRRTNVSDRLAVLIKRGLACYECSALLHVPEVGLSLATQYWGGRHHHNASKRMLCYVCTNKPIYSYLSASQAQKKFALNWQEMRALRPSHNTVMYMFGYVRNVAVYWIKDVQRLADEKQAARTRIKMQKEDALAKAAQQRAALASEKQAAKAQKEEGQAKAVQERAARASKAQQARVLTAQASAQAENASAPASISSSERAQLNQARREGINDIMITVRQEQLVEAVKSLGASTNVDTWRSATVKAYLAGRWLELAPLGIEDANGVAAHLLATAITSTASGSS